MKADDKVTSAPVTTWPAQGEPELRVEIWPDEFAQFIGTAAQLTAEFPLLQDIEWPSGSADKHWTAGRFVYWLRRVRPEGHKGPKSSWVTLDSWFLRTRVEGRDYRWHAQRRVQRMAAELKAEQYRLTPAGNAEWSAKWERRWAAERDSAFQAFKARVPGLVPPKRGRKTKAAQP